MSPDVSAAVGAATSPPISRRERQLVEILRLAVDGELRRAAALAAEHLEEFPDDALALTVVERGFRQRAAP